MDKVTLHFTKSSKWNFFKQMIVNVLDKEFGPKGFSTPLFGSERLRSAI